MSAVERFGACVADEKAAQVLILIDESGSLQDSDPQAARVTAATYLVDQLAQFSIDTGATVDVAVAGFSTDYRQQLNWTRLDAPGQAAAGAAIESLRDRDTGQDTDYLQALEGAQKALSAKPASADGAIRCRALAWFTDGKLDFAIQQGESRSYASDEDLGSQSGVDATIAAAKKSICRPGGLADQLRSSGIVMFGIGLAPVGAANGDFDLLKSISTGEPTSSGPCGDVTTPRPGDFYLAQNIDDLLFAFDAFSTPGQPPLQFETGVCPGMTICEDAKHRFVLDTSVRTVNVLASADQPGLLPVLVPPAGPPQELNEQRVATTLNFGGVQVNYRWLSDKSLTMRIWGSSSADWPGIWALVFQDPSGTATARTKSSIHISGDLFPAWPEAAKTVLHQDSVAPLAFVVVDGERKVVDTATLPGQAALTVTLIDADGGAHIVVSAAPKDQIGLPRELDLHGVRPGNATMRLTLAVTTADAVDKSGVKVPGTTLAPQSVDLPVTVNPPVGYPSIDRGELDFGLLEGAGTRSAKLQVVGPGCAWVAANAGVTVIASPDGVQDVSVTSSANEQSQCVQVDQGASAPLSLDLSVPTAGNGAINGTVQISLAPRDQAGPAVTVDVPFTATLERPLNAQVFWLAVLVGLILGPGIPLVLLYLVKWGTARIPGVGLRAQEIPVQVNDSSVLRDNRPFALRDSDLVQLVQGLDGRTRRLQIGASSTSAAWLRMPAVELRTRIGFSPFGRGYVVASSPGRAGAAGPDGAMDGKAPDAKLPLAVHNSWAVFHDPGGPAEAASVLLLVGSEAGRDVTDRLATEIAGRLPQILLELRKQMSANGLPPTPSDRKGDNPFTSPGGRAPSPFPPTAVSPNPFGGSQTGPPTVGGVNPQAGMPPVGTDQDPFGTGASSPSGNPFRRGDSPPNRQIDPTEGDSSSRPVNPFR